MDVVHTRDLQKSQRLREAILIATQALGWVYHPPRPKRGVYAAKRAKRTARIPILDVQKVYVCRALFGARHDVLAKASRFHLSSAVQDSGKPDAEAQKASIAKYESLKSTLGDDDQIVFMDGVHPSHAVRFVRGWIRKGNAGKSRRMPARNSSLS